ncbi:MAG: hypothetical protein H8E30_09395 [Alphaproteobacteria bacterium]|nr:hypothetical protein [Alphaproteobacteria bacterium]
MSASILRLWEDALELRMDGIVALITGTSEGMGRAGRKLSRWMRSRMKFSPA